MSDSLACLAILVTYRSLTELSGSALYLQKTVNLYPFQIHSIALSTFGSLIGPFGGFFASGFKRAFKIKVSLTITQFLQ